MKTIVVFAPEYFHINGGAGVYSRNFINKLLTKNLNVKVYTIGHKSYKKDCLEVISICKPIGLLTNFIYQFKIFLLNFSNIFNADIVHNMNYANFSDLFLWKKSNYFCTVHSTPNTQAKGVFQALMNFEFSFFELCYLLSYPIQKIQEVIYSFKNINYIQVSKKVKPFNNEGIISYIGTNFYSKRRFGDFIVVVGRLNAQKGAIRLVKDISKAKPNQNFVFVGKSCFLFNYYFKKCRRVVHIPQVPHKNALKIISQAKLLVSYSYQENIPLIFYEALMLGVPILSKNSGGILEILDNENIVSNFSDLISKIDYTKSKNKKILFDDHFEDVWRLYNETTSLSSTKS